MLKRLGISTNYKMYSWKVTGVVAMWHATRDIIAIMRQLRHADISMTYTYSDG